MAENTVNNEENLNSKSSQLEKEDLQKLEAESVPVNTKKPCVVAPCWWLSACKFCGFKPNIVLLISTLTHMLC